MDGDEDVKALKVQTVKRKRKILAEKDGNVNAAKVVETVAKRFGVVGREEEISKQDDSKEPVPKLASTKAHFPPALDRVFVRIESNKPDAMEFNFTFGGSDVFAGLRHLAELGGIDVVQMPSWLTGEEGASIIMVRDGAVIDGRAAGA